MPPCPRDLCDLPLQSELKQKDGRLRQLRAAIKALEGKLTELLRDKTDM